MCILNGESSARPYNHTLIFVIPKVKTPTTVQDFWPISLCMVVYKLVAKNFANCLNLILPSVIHDKQSAFVPHCNTLDNVMVGFELMHSIKRMKQGKRVAMALKLDMAKAYDHVEWSFIEAMMLQLGFPSSFVVRIMDCLHSVSFSVLWHSTPFGLIIPQRDLR